MSVTWPLTLHRLWAANQRPTLSKRNPIIFSASIRVMNKLTQLVCFPKLVCACVCWLLKSGGVSISSTCVAGLFVTVQLWISTDERWITGSLLGCQRATLSPFTPPSLEQSISGRGYLPSMICFRKIRRPFQYSGSLLTCSSPPSLMNYAPVISWRGHTKGSPMEIWIWTIEFKGSTRTNECSYELWAEGSKALCANNTKSLLLLKHWWKTFRSEVKMYQEGKTSPWNKK